MDQAELKYTQWNDWKPLRFWSGCYITFDNHYRSYVP